MMAQHDPPLEEILAEVLQPGSFCRWLATDPVSLYEHDTRDLPECWIIQYLSTRGIPGLPPYTPRLSRGEFPSTTFLVDGTHYPYPEWLPLQLPGGEGLWITTAQLRTLVESRITRYPTAPPPPKPRGPFIGIAVEAAPGVSTTCTQYLPLATEEEEA